MIFLTDFVPSYCPRCGTDTQLTRARNEFEIREGAPRADSDYRAHASHRCPKCGTHYQMASKEQLISASDASGGNLKQYA